MGIGAKDSGKIKLSSSILSGELETGSAGIMIVFISLFMIVTPVLIDQLGGSKKKWTWSRRLAIIISLGVVFVFFILMLTVVQGTAQMVVISIVSMFCAIYLPQILLALLSGEEEPKNEK